MDDTPRCKKWWHSDCQYYRYSESWNHYWAGWVIGIPIIIAVVLAGWLLFKGATWIDRTQCRNTATNMQTEYRWSLSTGCMLQTQDGTYVLRDQYIVNAPEEG